jgi:hypothetical protein
MSIWNACLCKRLILFTKQDGVAMMLEVPLGTTIWVPVGLQATFFSDCSHYSFPNPYMLATYYHFPISHGSLCINPVLPHGFPKVHNRAIFFLMGWDWVHLVLRPLFCLLYQLQMIDDDCGANGGMRIGRGNQSTRKKPAPVPVCQPQIPYYLIWDRTRSAAVGSRRATVWAMHGLAEPKLLRLLYIREMTGSNLARNTDYPNRGSASVFILPGEYWGGNLNHVMIVPFHMRCWQLHSVKPPPKHTHAKLFLRRDIFLLCVWRKTGSIWASFKLGITCICISSYILNAAIASRMLIRETLFRHFRKNYWLSSKIRILWQLEAAQNTNTAVCAVV